jgi:hypothetical protein
LTHLMISSENLFASAILVVYCWPVLIYRELIDSLKSWGIPDLTMTRPVSWKNLFVAKGLTLFLMNHFSKTTIPRNTTVLPNLGHWAESL